jgi:predicted transcriptional regulator
MENYRKQWVDLSKESSLDATLEALTAAALRTNSKEYAQKSEILWNLLRGLQTDDPYLTKLKQVYNAIKPFEEQQTFKKWWE